jgi:malate synthase
VAHPALVSVAKSAFDENMQGLNQIARPLSPAKIVQYDLLTTPDGPVTEKGVEINVDVSLQYLASWLGGTGCVPIYDLMEDAATAEISRSQLWQWIRNSARMTDGTTVDLELVKNIVAKVFDRIRTEIGEEPFQRSYYNSAARLLIQMVSSVELPEFLTSVAYTMID